MDYAETADELARRILTLIPDHPEILTINEAWDLFKVPGFRCDDLGPSYMQAVSALAKARHLYRTENGGNQTQGGNNIHE